MKVTVNGALAELDPGLTVAGLVAARTEDSRRVAVAVGGEVVPRSAWETTVLNDGDAVEILAAVAGG